MNSRAPSALKSQTYGLVELLRDLWINRWKIGSVIMGLCITGIVAGLLLPKEYTASVVFEPVLSEMTPGGLGAISSSGSGLGGLAALAGIALPGKSQDDEAIAVLQSAVLTRSFIEQHNLMPTLFPSLWDPALKRWKVGSGNIPTLWRANLFFAKKVRKVVEDQKSGMYVLSIRWTNPTLAAEWANELVKMTNDYLRDQAVLEAERNIKYLNAQAAQATDVGVKDVIYSLLESQIDNQMIAEGRRQYALKVVDPAYTPQKPSSLGAVALGVIGFLSGTMLSIFVIFFLGVLRSD